MDRLDTHKDNWRDSELIIDLGTDLPLPETVNLKVILFLTYVFLFNITIFIYKESRNCRNTKWKKELEHEIY